MGFQLTIEPLGETIDVEDDQRVLDACLRAGIWLPYACNHGLCGTCKVQVVDGEVEHNEASIYALMDLERREGKCLACTATLLSDCTIEADVDVEPDARNLPVADYAGRVAGIENLTPTVKAIFIEIEGDGLAFQAGQYVNVRVPGVEAPRAFSIASSPRQPGLIELNVRRVPEGAATGYLHTRLAVGATLSFSGPLGRFFVRGSSPLPLLFLAGGSGLSSPRSMILDLIAAGETRPITLVYGARNRAELYYDDEFRALATRTPNFRYVPALSEPVVGDDWDGEIGHVHEAAERCFGKRFEGHKAYLCGPPAMIEACIRSLMQGRLFERDIYTEKFLTAADGREGLARSPLFRRL